VGVKGRGGQDIAIAERVHGKRGEENGRGKGTGRQYPGSLKRTRKGWIEN